MDKIIIGFKNLYKGENVSKIHWLSVLLFILPALTMALFQISYDADAKKVVYPVLLLAGVVTFILAIFPVLLLSGFWVKFLNKRIEETEGLPSFGFDCLLKGLKLFVINFVWLIYILIPMCVYIVLVILIGNLLPQSLTLVHTVLQVGAIILAILGLFILLFIVNAFIFHIYIKFSEDFKFSPVLFNPITVFKNMKAAFKETMIVALKFIVVNFVSTIATRIIVIIAGFVVYGLGFAYAFLFPVNSEFLLNPWYIAAVVICSTVVMIINIYINWIVQLAYADNMVDVYKKKFMTTQLQFDDIKE